MKRTDYKIHIVGAGISGLIAAKTLEAQGYKPVIIESSGQVGGRVKTDIINNYQLDHGFQVLLEAYPMAKKHLDYKALQLQKFIPGAVIFKNGKASTIGDPLRDLSLLFSTLTANVGNFSDKLNILKLNVKLKKKSLEDIFSSEELSTHDYLVKEGFSADMISSFFKPFFAGIFLEPHLETSSRMFEFVYKMFGEGLAVMPKAGIKAIPEQLQSQLKHTKFLFNTKVSEVKDDHILLENQEKLDTHFTIIATEATSLISNLNTETHWKSCDNLYFTLADRHIKKPIIGLVADDDALINNLFFNSNLDTSTSGNQELLSVTVVKSHNLNEEQLIERVQADLKTYCDIKDTVFLKRYTIKKALPKLKDLQNNCSPTETQLKPTIFLAGDQMLNGSLNAAMCSGERAAQGLILTLEDGLRVEGITSEYR
ncbi:FAD-dependent oxidoreductase [Sediminibacter sp. Hel_I_10]|uniref:FAD-dependent oxidoreductase n=1 Tax=Sediminibacter sp. Hel_I_10 TaxID=1392490 RepID=UPI00047ADAE1|nr:FAD-dependent oxidoreductase [Sediminibacter sp. Hel_I_10]